MKMWDHVKAATVLCSRGVTWVCGLRVSLLAERYKAGDHYMVASTEGKADALAHGYKKMSILGYIWPEPSSANASFGRYGLPSISRDDASYKDQDYWHGRIWAPMVQLTYWGLEQYSNPVVKNATAGLVVWFASPYTC